MNESVAFMRIRDVLKSLEKVETLKIFAEE
jgi:hypothetical protein